MLQNNELFPQAICSSPTLQKDLNPIPLFWLKISVQIIVSELQETEKALMKPWIGREM